MDPSKKPCGDFYQYARGGWLQHHVIPEASALYSISDILRDKLEVILKSEGGLKLGRGSPVCQPVGHSGAGGHRERQHPGIKAQQGRGPTSC